MVPRLGIRGRITLIVLVSITALTICMTFISYYNMDRLMVDKSTGYLQQDLMNMKVEVERRIQSIDDLTKSIISDSSVQKLLSPGRDVYAPDTQSIRNSMDQMISRLIYSRTEIDSVYIYNMNGDILYGEQSFPINKSVGFDHIQSKVGGFRSGLTVFDPPSHNTYIPLAKAIRSVSNFQTIGYLQVNFREYAMKEMFMDTMSEPESMVLVHNAEGALISSINERYKPEEVTQAVREGSGSANERISLGGERSAWAVHQSSSSNWTYTAVLPVKYITGEINSIVYTNLITGLVFILISIVGSILIGWNISRPIIEIARSIRKVEYGDFNIQTHYTNKDEIGVLSRAFNKMVQEINRLINEVYKLKLLEKEQQLRMLQAQINPHFLYNTFDSINYLAQKYKAEPVSRMIVALGSLMRASVLSTPNVTLRDELVLIEHYLAIQKIRFGDRLTVHYDMNEDVLDIRIPRLILQPIVENCIVHGLENRTEPGIIEITVTDAGDAVVVQVDDNGCGMSEEALASLLDGSRSESGSGGIGMSSVSKRLQLVFGSVAALSVTSKPGEGTRVGIRLPKASEEQEGMVALHA